MLLPAQLREFAHTGGQLLFSCHEPASEGFSFSGQLVFVVSGVQQGVQFLVEFVVPVVSRAVTRIVADVKGLVTFRRLGQFCVVERVWTVVAVCFLGVLIQLFQDVCLCSRCDGKDHEEHCR